MPLTGQQFKSFQDALLEAYDQASLQQVVRIGLDEKLDTIAGGANLKELTFNLIQWAERTGRVDDLLAATLKENPSSPALRGFAEGYRPNAGSGSGATVTTQQYNVVGDVYNIGHVTGTTIAVGRKASVVGSTGDKPDAAS